VKPPIDDEEVAGIFIALCIAAIFFVLSCADAIDNWRMNDIHQPKIQEVRR
jgi:hypothetical protein